MEERGKGGKKREQDPQTHSCEKQASCSMIYFHPATNSHYIKFYLWVLKITQGS